MSEYCVNAYFLDKVQIQKAVGSRDQSLKEEILADNSKIIANFSSRFSKKELVQTARELIDGNIEEHYPFHYSFATWALIDVLANERPNDPYIGYPFVRLSDFYEILKEENIYPLLFKVFESIDGMNADFELPISIGEWGDMPCITFLDLIDDSFLQEVKQMQSDIESEAEWTFEFDDDIDDIDQILTWLVEAHAQKKSICIILEGSL